MIGERCILCRSRYPGCQDHCGYGIAAKAERQAKKDEKEKQMQREAQTYYATKRYRR